MARCYGNSDSLETMAPLLSLHSSQEKMPSVIHIRWTFMPQSRGRYTHITPHTTHTPHTIHTTHTPHTFHTLTKHTSTLDALHDEAPEETPTHITPVWSGESVLVKVVTTHVSITSCTESKVYCKIHIPFIIMNVQVSLLVSIVL